MKKRKKLLCVATVLMIAFLSMAGGCQFQIPGTDIFCVFFQGKGLFCAIGK